MKLSARNVFAGTVANVVKGAVNSEVVIVLPDGPKLTAIVTNGSAERLGLSQGKKASAIIKAGSVILGTDVKPEKISTRNVFLGKVSKVSEGPVNCEVIVDIGGGHEVVAVVTRESFHALGIKTGVSISALFKASSVILGVD
jgi:molybdate transport system regulatory protein